MRSSKASNSSVSVLSERIRVRHALVGLDRDHHKLGLVAQGDRDPAFLRHALEYPAEAVLGVAR
jgi:hypothetical protein